MWRVCGLSVKTMDPYKTPEATNDVLYQLLANSVSEVIACVTVALMLAGELVAQQLAGTTVHCVYSCPVWRNGFARSRIDEPAGLTMLKMLVLVPGFRIWVLDWKQRGVRKLATLNGIEGFRNRRLLECFYLQDPAVFVSGFVVVVMMTGIAQHSMAWGYQ